MMQGPTACLVVVKVDGGISRPQLSCQRTQTSPLALEELDIGKGRKKKRRSKTANEKRKTYGYQVHKHVTTSEWNARAKTQRHAISTARSSTRCRPPPSERGRGPEEFLD
mmetsp:Transcript_46/g.112  ORF Transcript_46/g.112 Transcript_46/m.112 type:complete len:110 (-) Transcript_46:189-518(-)